jgi:hypothetical protein
MMSSDDTQREVNELRKENARLKEVVAETVLESLSGEPQPLVTPRSLSSGTRVRFSGLEVVGDPDVRTRRAQPRRRDWARSRSVDALMDALF